MELLKLFMVLLGGRPKERNIEQHDIFFGIGKSLKDLGTEIENFWPAAEGSLHIDAWREVTEVDGFAITVSHKEVDNIIPGPGEQLFFLNLGGYKAMEFEEFHYRMLVVCKEKSDAIKLAKQTAFYKHTGSKGACAHIDDKFGVDVDDIYQIRDILSRSVKDKYSLQILVDHKAKKDHWHLGYLTVNKLINS